MNLIGKWRNSTIGRSSTILTRKDKVKVLFIVFLQVFLGLLDLAGVAIVGVLGALAVSGVQSGQPGNRISEFLEILHLSNLQFQGQIAILGAAAALLLVAKTILSIFFTRRILFFLSRRGSQLSASLVSQLLARPLVELQSRTSLQTLFALTNGVNSITLGILGTTVWLIADTALLVVMAIGLFVVNPIVATSTAIFFALIGLTLAKLLNGRARVLGQKDSTTTIASNEKILEVLSTYRESVVKNRRAYYANEIGALRLKNADITAEISFMPYIGKYVIEVMVVVGALLISATQFLVSDAGRAVATLSVFLVAGTRIAPAVLRIQQGTLAIKNAIGAAHPTLELIEEMKDSNQYVGKESKIDFDYLGFVPSVELKNISLKYPGQTINVLNDLSLIIREGSHVAIVGPSGAGKTSLIDAILGILTVQSGSVEISGLNPISAIERWPGAIGYVPQDTAIVNGTVSQNVTLGYPKLDSEHDLVSKALVIAQLDEIVAKLPNGIDTQVGERGAKLSGGQRQRLGIARALYSKPQLLVLDEATSALDGESEYALSKAIHNLKGKVTIVLIAHRLSSVREVDQVIYLDKGKIVAQGSFDEVRLQVPDFDKQAKLMGL